jgi:hypothetical protein
MDTHITFVLDSSGSMEAIADDTRGGFNAFLDDQRKEEGTATVTLYDFNTTVDQVYEGYPIGDAQNSMPRTTRLAAERRCTTPSPALSTRRPKKSPKSTQRSNQTTLWSWY